MGRSMLGIALCGALCSMGAHAADWKDVETILGREGTVQGEMLKVTFPRSDLRVTVGEVPVESGLALTSWVAFGKMWEQTMMMGDLVLLENEVEPVMSALESSAIEVTALHNHLLGETPHVLYMHFHAMGDATALATHIKAALGKTATPMERPSPATAQATPDWSAVEQILGKTGMHKGDIFSVGIPRAGKITEDGFEIPPYLGVATSINIAMANGKAATTGDFVLTAKEVNPVIRALTGHGIAVTAVHIHMLEESPRLFFLHFWGYDQPDNLARWLKAALAETHSAP